MPKPSAIDEVLEKLNHQQREAATFGDSPLLIIAGAGTGKTATLVHRVACLISQGVDPGRILLLTFTRRAAAEMLRRVDGLLRQLDASEPRIRSAGSRIWGGTFHAVATRLLRRYGKMIDLPPQFGIHDRGDSEDLINVVRTELKLNKTDKRFPQKGTCMAIYSRCVNSQEDLKTTLAHHFPWCGEWAKELKQLFDAYVDRKEAAGVLDYDDLLLYWSSLLADEKAGAAVRKLFDCVLVDEYQDTNALQADILYRLRPDGKGLTVVGDDAQAIYSFRAATVRNILDFPKHYPGATVLPLEQNYRSTPTILEATNQVIALAEERYTKNLWSQREPGELPCLVHCEDEDDQAEFLIRKILEHRESGTLLRRQAVLFRASHHSMVFEAELARRNIPFHKYGGLRFVEAAHIKDLLAFLRLAENPHDVVAGGRILPLLPGIGPVKARQLIAMLAADGGGFSAWRSWKAPPAAAKLWPRMVALLEKLAGSKDPLPSQVHQARKFYAPLAEQKFDNPGPRLRDLEQLEQIASRYRRRDQMLTELTLDPPSSTQDLAGPPHLDDDYLVLSTIHSAKGLEWDAVYVIHASDGNIPSDMATGSSEQIEEERRLFYVALTRAKNWLYVCCPIRYYRSFQSNLTGHYGFAQRTRFLPESVVQLFETRVSSREFDDFDEEDVQTSLTSRKIRRKTKELWK